MSKIDESGKHGLVKVFDESKVLPLSRSKPLQGHSRDDRPPFVEAPIGNPIQPRYLQREAARRNAETLFTGRPQRLALAKQDAVSQSAANDAKTIRLRALRLEKEAADLEAETARKAAMARRPV